MNSEVTITGGKPRALFGLIASTAAVALCGCLDYAEVEGAACDETHPCPGELTCFEGVCSDEPGDTSSDSCDGGPECSPDWPCENEQDCAVGLCIAEFGVCGNGSCGPMDMMDECDNGWSCLSLDGTCSTGTGMEKTGVCVKIPTAACPENDDPVCGCNGQTFANPCQMFKASVFWAHNGACE